MARTGRFTHLEQDTTTKAVDTSFGTSKRHSLELRPPTMPDGSRRGDLGALYVFLDTIVTATTLTIRVTRDANGDECLVPDTDSTIWTGVTNSTDGSAVFDLDIPFGLVGGDTVYVFLKLNAGTANWNESALTWQE